MTTTLEPAGHHADLLNTPPPGLPADAFAERRHDGNVRRLLR
ncbi:hypothetical protein [Paractinoplanes hotanensis]|nr:hypothetical protein [Actinoplanes hotanensis]